MLTKKNVNRENLNVNWEDVKRRMKILIEFGGLYKFPRWQFHYFCSSDYDSSCFTTHDTKKLLRRKIVATDLRESTLSACLFFSILRSTCILYNNVLFRKQTFFGSSFYLSLPYSSNCDTH